MSLTEQELKQFEGEGYVVKPQVFAEEDLNALRDALDEIVATEADQLHAEGKLPNTFADEPFERRLACIMSAEPEAGQAIYKAIMGKKGGGGYTGPAMFRMIVHPPLLSCIESIIGPDIVASSVYRIRPKMPRLAIGEVPWHQDSGYMNAHCDRHMIVTCWIPLVDATIDNGCLWVQPKAHKKGVVRHYFGGNSHYLVITDEDLPAQESIPVEMKAGDVLFLTNTTPHCSKENSTDIVRWSFDLRYQSLNVPTNAEQEPEEYDPNREPVEMACYPPEADFIVRCPSQPEREVRTPEAFHELRRRYEEAEYISYPQRGWVPLPEKVVGTQNTVSPTITIMMTEEQRFLFDVQGYLVIPNALEPERVQRMLAEMDARSIDPPEEKSDDYRFGDFLRWSDDYRYLIDHPVILPILAEILGPKFRLDHAYGMAARNGRDRSARSDGNNLHHTAGLFEHGCYYVTHGPKMHNGLVVVSYSLTDIEPGSGGFCCIPGSHKASFKMPDHFYQIDDNPLVRQIPQRAGDAVIFTEALTHGTWPWTNPNAQRRSVLMKYCPHYMQWAKGPMDSSFGGLTERQQLIMQGAFVWQRPVVPVDEATV